MKPRTESPVLTILLIVAAVAFALFLLGQGSGITGLTIIEGNASAVNATSTGLRQFVVLVNGSVASFTTNYTGNLTVRFMDNLTTNNSNFTFYQNVSEFIFDFSANTLNLTPVLIQKQTGALSIRNLSLFNSNKSIFVEKQSLYVCIKDLRNATIASITENCSSADERVVRCNSTRQFGYACESLGLSGELRVTNLSNTSVKSLPFILSPVQLAQGANFTINITGQDFGNLSNVTVGISGDIVRGAFRFVNNTFMNLSLAVRFNASLGHYNITLFNGTTAYRVHVDALQIVAPLNVSTATIEPVIANTSNLTLFNITFPLGAGLNASSLNLTIFNITFNNSNQTIAVNITNVSIGVVPNSSTQSLQVTFNLTPPFDGVYTVRMTANLSQRAPFCTTTNCTKAFVSSQLGRLAISGNDTSFDCTSTTLTDASSTTTLGTENLSSTAASISGILGGTATCQAGDTINLGITIGGVSGSPVGSSNQITHPSCSTSGTVVSAQFTGSFLPGSVILSASSSNGAPFRVQWSSCTVATVTTPTSTTTVTVLGSTTGGSAKVALDMRCLWSPDAHQYALRIDNPLDAAGTYPIDSPIAQAFSRGKTEFARAVQAAVDSCETPCTRKIFCEPGQHIRIEKFPHPPCGGTLILPCGGRDVPTPGGGFTNDDINEGFAQLDDCCAGVTPQREVPGIPGVPKVHCDYQDQKQNYQKCVEPPARITYWTREWKVGSPKPPCNDIESGTFERAPPTPCPTVSKINECWSDPKTYCKNNACALDMPVCTGDAACCYNPNGLAPNACAMQHIGGGTLFTYDGMCRGCTLDCSICDLPFFAGIFGGLMGAPGDVLINCFSEAQQEASSYAWSPFYPPKSPFQPPPPAPVPRPAPVPAGEPKTTPTPGPEVQTGYPPALTTTVTTQPPAPKPALMVVDQPAVICATAGGSGTGRISKGGEVDASKIPAGDEIITTFSTTCPRGQNADISLNVPNNYAGIRVFLLTEEGLEPAQAIEAQEASCGRSATSTIRAQQISASRGEYYALQEMPAIIRQEAVVLPNEQLRLETEGYVVELLGTIGTARATLSMPESDVPYPANPSARIIGTPLLVTFDQHISGRVRVTFPEITPLFIDPASVGIFALIGTTWRTLEGVEIKDGAVSAVIDDISLFLTQQDGKYQALFAMVGVYCASCPGTKLEKVYGGGSRNAVLLIHGITTDSLRWQTFVDDFALTRQPFQVWTFSYPLSMDPDEAAQELASQLEQQASGFDTLSIVTHSMGGIEAQRALDYARKNGFSFARKVDNVIFAGQPGLGSPAAEVYGRLFGFLLNVRSTAMLFAEDLPMLQEAVTGRQVPRTQGVEYHIIAGRQPYKFTADLFAKNGVYDPNDGIVTTRSARTVGNQEINDQCGHYFEVPVTHTDLIDDWLPRRIMGRIVGKDMAEQEPDKPIIGYNKIVQVSAECKPGTYVVVGRRIPEEATADPAGCNCGNGVCGEGENAENCPSDCSRYYQLFYPCRIAPWLWFPVLLVLLIVSTLYTARAIKRHKRGPGASWLLFFALVLFAVLLTQHLACGAPPLLGYLIAGFIIVMLSSVLVHLGLHKRDKGIDDAAVHELESLLKRAKGE